MDNEFDECGPDTEIERCFFVIETEDSIALLEIAIYGPPQPALEAQEQELLKRKQHEFIHRSHSRMFHF